MKTIYLDVDEEITSAIDRIKKAKETEITLVIPKGAALVQSLVNLKLLKRQAESLGKKISIVTGDRIGKILASQAGLESQDRISERMPKEESKPEVKEETKEKLKEKTEVKKEVVIEKKSLEPQKQPKETGFSKKELSEEPPVSKEIKEAIVPKKEKPSRSFAFPLSFLKKLTVVVLLLIIILAAAGALLLPKAKATIVPQAKPLDLSAEFKIDKSVSATDLKNNLLLGKLETQEKELSSKGTATGEKLVGEKATGVIKAFNYTSSKLSWGTGTSFAPIASGDRAFVSTKGVEVPANGGVTDIPVVAAEVGDQYNGFSNTDFFLKSAGVQPPEFYKLRSFSGMSGGSSKKITVISNEDFQGLKDSLSQQILDSIEADFKKKITVDLIFLPETFKKEITKILSTAAVGDETKSFTLTVKANASGLLFSKNDFQKLAEKVLKEKIAQNEEIVDSGIKKATFETVSLDLSQGKADLKLKSQALVAKKIDREKIKSSFRFKTQKQALEILKKENFKEVKIELWPRFWKFMPILKNKIEIEVTAAK